MTDQDILEESGIDEMPGTIANLIHHSLAANRDLAKESVSQWLSGRRTGYHQLVQMGKLHFTWNFSVVRTQEKKVFFGFKRQYGERPIIKTDLSMDLLPTPQEEPLVLHNHQQLDYRLALPNFILTDLSQAQKNDYLSALRGLSDIKRNNAVFFSVGPKQQDVLTVVPRRFLLGKPRCQYTPASGDPFEIKSSNGLWPLDPFLSLFSEIIAWITGSAEHCRMAPLHMDFTGGGTGVQDMLAQIVQAWTQGSLSTVPPADNTILDALRLNYALENFESHILLRVDEEGDLTTQDEQQVFQLRLRSDIVPGPERPTFRAFLTLPDFLVRLKMRENIIAPFIEGPGLLELEAQTGAHSLVLFMEQAKEKAFTFRISRLKKQEGNRFSKNVFIMRAPYQGSDTLLIFKASMRKKNPESPPDQTDFLYVHLVLLYFGPAIPGQHGFDKETLVYISKLADALWNWVEAADTEEAAS